FFFFQAEDGIRDRNVTGVQTCALPISFSNHAGNCVGGHAGGKAAWHDHLLRSELSPVIMEIRRRQKAGTRGQSPHRTVRERNARSEERRVGKECRSRWSREQ